MRNRTSADLNRVVALGRWSWPWSPDVCHVVFGLPPNLGIIVTTTDNGNSTGRMRGLEGIIV